MLSIHILHYLQPTLLIQCIKLHDTWVLAFVLVWLDSSCSLIGVVQESGLLGRDSASADKRVLTFRRIAVPSFFSSCMTLKEKGTTVILNVGHHSYPGRLVSLILIHDCIRHIILKSLWRVGFISILYLLKQCTIFYLQHKGCKFLRKTGKFHHWYFSHVVDEELSQQRYLQTLSPVLWPHGVTS
jgi:hypothetical protein